MITRLKQAWRFVVTLKREWQEDHAGLLAAAVAFYAIFSLGPMLLLLVQVAGIFLENDDAAERITRSVSRFVTPRTTEAIGTIITAASSTRSATATLVSALLLLLGASAVFRHLRVSLNIVFEVPTPEDPGWKRFILSRLVAVATAIGMMLFLFSSIVLSAALGAVRSFMPGLVAGDVLVWRMVEFAVTTLLLVVFFGAVLKLVPDTDLRWRDVLVGAGAAAVMFTAGRVLLSVYFSNTNAAGMYGAAGSLFIVLLMVYFAALVLLAAAEITQLRRRSDR